MWSFQSLSYSSVTFLAYAFNFKPATLLRSWTKFNNSSQQLQTILCCVVHSPENFKLWSEVAKVASPIHIEHFVFKVNLLEQLFAVFINSSIVASKRASSWKVHPHRNFSRSSSAIVLELIHPNAILPCPAPQMALPFPDKVVGQVTWPSCARRVWWVSGYPETRYSVQNTIVGLRNRRGAREHRLWVPFRILTHRQPQLNITGHYISDSGRFHGALFQGSFVRDDPLFCCRQRELLT